MGFKRKYKNTDKKIIAKPSTIIEIVFFCIQNPFYKSQPHTKHGVLHIQCPTQSMGVYIYKKNLTNTDQVPKLPINELFASHLRRNFSSKVFFFLFDSFANLKSNHLYNGDIFPHSFAGFSYILCNCLIRVLNKLLIN